MEKRLNDILSNFNEIDSINTELKANANYNYKSIECTKKLTLVKASAKFARDIYYKNFINEIDSLKVEAIDITDEENNVKAYALYKINSPKEIVIIIRGSTGLKNWILNILLCGKGLFLKFFISVSFFLTALLTYRKFVFGEFVSKDLYYFPDWLSYEVINDPKSELLGKNIDVLHSALPIILLMILLTLFLNLFLRKKISFVHYGYTKCADNIINNLKAKKKISSFNRILVIGHSLAGGVSELVVEKISASKSTLVRGVVFNSAPGQSLKSSEVLYITYGLDALTIINQIFIRIVENKLKISNNHLDMIMKNIIYLAFGLIIGLIICVKFESIGVVGFLNKIMTIISSSLIIYIYPFILGQVKSSFKSNHLMDNLINEIDT